MRHLNNVVNVHARNSFRGFPEAHQMHYGTSSSAEPVESSSTFCDRLTQFSDPHHHRAIPKSRHHRVSTDTSC